MWVLLNNKSAHTIFQNEQFYFVWLKRQIINNNNNNTVNININNANNIIDNGTDRR